MLRIVRTVPVFGSDGSSGEGFSVCFSIVEDRSTVLVSVPEKRFRRFRVPFLENGSDRSGFRFRLGSWAILFCWDRKTLAIVMVFFFAMEFGKIVARPCLQ